MAVQVGNVSISFPSTGEGRLKVLDQVNFGIEEGSFTTLVGPSGCGKSTLLQIMAGLLPASSGSVSMDGGRYSGPPREIIYLFQQYTRSLMPWLSVRDNVAFGLKKRGDCDAREIARRTDEFIGVVGLKGFEGFFPRQISGGMQQRVAIARALVCRPRVILMDEPFSSVDALTRQTLQDEMLRLWKTYGLTVVFVTHDIEEAIYLGQRVLVLGGRPARLIDDVAIDLPQTRAQLETREHPNFLRHRHHLMTTILNNPSAAPEAKVA